MKQKPILSEGTVRKFMKLANLGKVGEGFISEAYGQEEEKLEEGEEESLEEDKNFGGTKGHAMKPAPKAKKVMKEQEEEMGMDMDMPETPEVAPAEEPTEMDASSLADQIIQVLQGAGLVDVVEGDEEEHHAEEEGEGMPEEEGDEEEDEEEDEDLMEAKKRQVAKIVAERVMKRLQREQKVDRLAETITKKVMARMAGK
jgi:hypothetical protein